VRERDYRDDDIYDDEDDVYGEERRPLMQRVAGRHPGRSIGALVLAGCAVTIMANALYGQPRPHPAPIFAAMSAPADPGPVTTGALRMPQPAPVPVPVPAPTPRAMPALAPQQAAPSRGELLAAVQTELTRMGFYKGTVDGIDGPRTDAAIRDFQAAANLRQTGEADAALLDLMRRATVVETKPSVTPVAAAAPAPNPRLIAVQRALSDYGYGPVKASGLAGPETRAAIERFERDRRLPVTGQMSDRLVRELSAMTGRHLD
jgi:peptidoglycan hydrolase-like protein with peptidoglycan-binding domain